MKIVLIHPPHLNSTDDRLDPPLGLLYLATHLRQAGFDVQVCDLSGLTDWTIPCADIYGITAYVSSLGIIKDITTSCKISNPNPLIVIGGAHASACPNDFPYADHIVVGPGEVAMVNIAKGKRMDRINYGTEPTDYFPMPAYDLIDIYSYHRRIAGKVSLPYLTSRGCPFACSFCGLTTMHRTGSGVKFADPQTVGIHLKHLKDTYGVDRIAFQDDIFTLNFARLKQILSYVKPLNIQFRCMGRAGYDTEETYKLLADSGCEQISWGIESGSQYILDRMNKRVRVEDNYNVIQWAKKYGITTRAFFIIGFPGETADTIEDTKHFINYADPDQYFASNFVPYPGTDVASNPEKYGIINISKDYSQFYQVSKDGTGGMTIDTQWLNKEELKVLELDFRNWLNKRTMKGELQEYEKR